MDKFKFWGFAVGFILFLWFLSPSPPDNTGLEVAPPAANKEANTIALDTSAHTPASAPVAEQGQPLVFRAEKIRIQTAKGILPLLAGIADNDTLREQGLMHYRIWPQNIHGVLFLFDTVTPLSMWMKNTYLSLDMIFINQFGNVVHIAENTTPLSETLVVSPVPVKAVFEVPAGSAKQWNITVGSTFLHPSFMLR